MPTARSRIWTSARSSSPAGPTTRPDRCPATSIRTAGAASGADWHRDTPPLHVVAPLCRRPYIWCLLQLVRRAEPTKGYRGAEATGNPVRVRDCPAAVSGNERRHLFAAARTGTALGLISLGSDGD